MSFIQIENPGDSVLLGLWKVEEDEEFFMERLSLYENENRILGSIRHPQRRLEWLSSRLCLKELLKISHKVESLNEITGKPYLSDNSFHISYSHSNLYSGAIASASTRVSIDLEDLTKKRNPETCYLFMTPSELVQFEQGGNLDTFFLIWSAKETLYKFHGDKGLVFKEDLIINPEGNKIEKSGVVTGIIKENGENKELPIHYRFLPGVLLTYTYDPERLRKVW